MKRSTTRHYLGKPVFVQIDRPFGALHPEHGFVYELNYGFVPGTIAEDREAQDAYILGVFEPLKEFTGVCIAVIERINDEEDKLILAEVGKCFQDDEILEQVHFQEQFFTIKLVRNIA